VDSYSNVGKVCRPPEVGELLRGTIPSDDRRRREACMAKKRAGGQSVPEAWIGRDVVIGVGGSGARVSGELREVSDRGVVLHYGAEHGRDPGHVFYPWSNVQAIQLPDEEKAADEEQPS
jgi:hypothetical protein